MKSEFLKIVVFSMMISALSLSACKKKVENQIQEFIGFKEAKHENVQITLPNLQKALKAAGLPEVKINAINQTLATETQRDTMRTHLMISLGMMSREQCEVARKVYADRWKDSLSGVHCSIAATIGRAGMSTTAGPNNEGHFRILKSSKHPRLVQLSKLAEDGGCLPF